MKALVVSLESFQKGAKRDSVLPRQCRPYRRLPK